MVTGSIETFSSYIVGNTSISIQCAEFLVSNDYSVHGIITSDATVKQWSKNEDIPCLFFPHDDFYDLIELQAFIRQNSFDYLFSIVNPLILSEAILEIPRIMAINRHYHD